MEEAAADFIKNYYTILDSSKRRTLENYYDVNAVLKWNYISYNGRMPIIMFLTGLPTMKHQIDSIKTKVDDDVVTVEVIGKVAVGYSSLLSALKGPPNTGGIEFQLGSGGSQPPFKEIFMMTSVDSEPCFLIDKKHGVRAEKDVGPMIKKMITLPLRPL
ncbi:hypothetical protein DL93DRAFT_2103755 [Clavulina sp. PMI_390]|nr:hypothetical protein DL93DRAFT_2103755 [Clavulina sp. PMI_390]